MKKINTMLLMSAFALPCFSQDMLSVQAGTTLGINAGTTVGVLGSVALQNGSTLINNGTLSIQKYSGSATADFISLNTAPYRMGSGTFVFQGAVGTGFQQLLCGDTLQRIDVNNDSLKLLSNVVSNKWYLIKGKVNTGENYAIAFSTIALAVEADAANTNFINSWINGRLRRYVLPTSVNNYVFPVGNSNGVNKLELDNLVAQPLTGIDYIDAAFRNKRGTDAGLSVTENSSTYTSINSGGIWHLTPNTLPTGGKYNLKLYFTGFTGLMDNMFGILRRADSSNNGTDWIVPIGSSFSAFNGNGRKVADGYAQRNNVSTFSQYGIGSTNTVFPLVMGDFSAIRLNKNSVLLNWNTTQEQDVKGFAVERKLDNENSYSFLSFINSKGNNGSSIQPLYYSLIDNNAYKQLSYYRLIITDKNNAEKYSSIKAVKGFGEKEVMVGVYPIPANSNIKVEVKGQLVKRVESYLADISGKIVLRFTVDKGINNINLQSLSAGNYVLVCVNAFGEGQNFTEKITIIK